MRSERAQGGIIGAARARRSRQRRDPLLRRHTAPTSTRATQRKIERLLYREDFRRAFAADIGDIVFPPRALEFYTAALEASVDAERLRHRSFKVVLDYSFGAASVVMPHVLGKIGAIGARGQPVRGDGAAPPSTISRPAVKIIGDLVRTSGSDLGLVFDPDGETATIIDDEGDRAHRPSRRCSCSSSSCARAAPGRAASRCRSR